MQTYAFIDVPNTTGTTRECLDFFIDWKKLYEHLCDEKWNCRRIFFYKGYKGNTEKEQLRRIEAIGYDVRTKLTHVHPNKYREMALTCDQCQCTFTYTHKIPGHRKSNCDVELTVDAVTTLQSGDRALLFTGDGDFAYLVEYLISSGVYVYIISSQGKDKKGNSRFSTRLKNIIRREEQEQKRVQYVPIKNWEKRIKKENRHEA